MSRTAYPSDVSDGEWAFLAPYLTLMRGDGAPTPCARCSTASATSFAAGSPGA